MNQATLTPGLVSVTFRKLSPREIVNLAAQARLESVEWGGDVHVPPGDLANARDVRRLTESAGLAVAAYGSYYRLDGGDFEPVLATAVELGAPVIRVWAGQKASADATELDWRAVRNDAFRIADVASKAGIKIAYEHHRNTLTDTIESTDRLLAGAPHPNLFTLWQPPHEESLDHNVESLRRMAHRLLNVHVFHWRLPDLARCALDEGEPRWRRYLNELHRIGGSRHLLLEFVRDESPEQLAEDAATLRHWLTVG
jgi:sugar phosphate isomerase/epimerase